MKQRKYYDSIYNEQIDRIGDILVPLPVFNDMVEFVEGTNSFEIAYTMRYDNEVHSYDATTGMCIMPYPYLESVAYSAPIVDFATRIENRKDVSNINKEIILTNAIREAISARIETFASNMLDRSIVEKIDSDPDVGCILHVSTGNMVFYHFSCVDDLQVIQLDNMIPRYLHMATLQDHDDIERELRDIRTIINGKPHYRHMYQFHYVKNDDFNPDGGPIFGTISDMACIGQEESPIIADNLINRVRARQKVILTA